VDFRIAFSVSVKSAMAVKVLEESIGEASEAISLGNDLLAKTSNPRATGGKTDKSDL
jgi:hypothetical protein